MTNPAVYRWPDKRAFHGDLVNEKPHGRGKLFVPIADGGEDMYQLLWENGTFFFFDLAKVFLWFALFHPFSTTNVLPTISFGFR
jgi:hypothetical protein